MPKHIYSILVISNLFSQVDYNTQIQPIFDNNCISCHIDGGAYFGGLDLSSYSLVIEGGSSGNTIIPFNHSSSELFNRITLDESDNDFMPQYGTVLFQSEIDLITQWIDEGALHENNNSYSIEGRWILPLFEGDPGNTMYEFLDGQRYTYYCTDENGCDSAYWNSLDTGDAIPNPDSYTFINDTLTIDGNSWSFVNFECDGNVISSSDDIVLWRVGFDTSECEELQLAIFSEIAPPETFSLHQNYPNPFNIVTNLSYDLFIGTYIEITLYDILGNRVNNLVNTYQSSGYKTIQWNATNNQGQPVSAGVYIFKIESNGFTQTRKMLLLK